jgi:hypothetical protein
VKEEACHWSDPPSKESYRLFDTKQAVAKRRRRKRMRRVMERKKSQIRI